MTYSEKERIFICNLCGDIKSLLRKNNFTGISKYTYTKMIDVFIGRCLIDKHVSVDIIKGEYVKIYSNGHYTLSRVKVIYDKLSKLESEDNHTFTYIVRKIDVFFKCLNSPDKFFECYIKQTRSIYTTQSDLYINYDDCYLKDSFFDLSIDQQHSLFMFLRTNILLFVEYCLIIDKENYISILMAYLWDAGFNIDLLSHGNVDTIYQSFQTLHTGEKVDFSKLKRDQIRPIVYELFFFNINIFYGTDNIDDDIDEYQEHIRNKYRIPYKKMKKKEKEKLNNQIDNEVICPCCFAKFIKN